VAGPSKKQTLAVIDKELVVFAINVTCTRVLRCYPCYIQACALAAVACVETLPAGLAFMVRRLLPAFVLSTVIYAYAFAVACHGTHAPSMACAAVLAAPCHPAP
jgi:hypothetical protein